MQNYCYSTPIEEQSIVITSVSNVCLSARLSQEPHAQTSPNFLCLLPVDVAGLSSGDSIRLVDDIMFAL